MDLGNERVAGVLGQLALFLCSLCGTIGEDVCDHALMSKLPLSAFKSSSVLSSSHDPGFAKLNRREGAGGWSPLTSDRHQWLQVDLGKPAKITAVATQGRYGSSDWLTSYLLMFSDTGHNWKLYRQEDSFGYFLGNSNADSAVQYKLQQPAVARFLRVIPLDWNPSGQIGLRLESYGCSYISHVMNLDDKSRGLMYKLSPKSRKISEDIINLNFKSHKNSGMLLLAEGPRGLGLILEIDRGKLLLMLQHDGASFPQFHFLASLGSLLDDQQWHYVTLERRKSDLNLTLDQHTERVHIPAQFSHWHIQQLSVGTLQNQFISKSNFHGCLENLQVNSMNLIEMAKHNNPQVTLKGNISYSCTQPVSFAVMFPGAKSFLRLLGTASSTSGSLSVGFQFRTWNRVGLLVTFNLPQRGGVFWLYLSEARLRLQVHKAGRMQLDVSIGSGLNDGQWHSIELISRHGQLTISVDKENGGISQASSTVPISIEGHIFFGGCPSENEMQECRNPFNVFHGCMRLLSLNDQSVDLSSVQENLEHYNNLQIDTCGIIDRCSPNLCEHGSSCSQSWSSFYCNCSGSGYSGATCHSSVYEQSCEAYKHNGNTSGNFYIDVDGSGPIEPQLVYCNMTEKNTWLVIWHNNTELTRLRPLSSGMNHSIYLNYSAGEEQLMALINQSDHCEQELSFRCKKSRLFNTLEGSLYSRWLGGPGPGCFHSYPVGADHGNQLCACSLSGSCVDRQHFCSCDASRKEWAEDSGLLTCKTNLPVRSLVLGNIQRPWSEAAYRVGPLRCHGDKHFWNAAFFDEETSYLSFPTFHGGLNAEISFMFKTMASSGVFLENLGIKDFIRIELGTSTQVIFSFDVGNGPLEVRVKARTPLNDNRWHRVRAEWNVKEASLRLDDFPVATLDAPTDGHFQLQLNSQLFIGGTASRQKGFRGCIRSLLLNGVTVDLEERAKMTPGVRPGCHGHCSSYGSLCKNQGRCVERDKGFHCDCSLSPHTGVFCHTEVSARFKSGTSVSYTFKQPYDMGWNSSSLPSSVHSGVALKGENISLSFRTNHSPALLLLVTSYFTDFLVLLINKHDKLEVRYKLDISREAEVLRSRVRNLANGKLHTVNVRRYMDSVSVQIDQHPKEDFNLTSDGKFNAIRSLVLGRLHDSDELDSDLARLASLSFTGCLSVVRFNSITPLKAALLHPDTSPVIIIGPLAQSNCGSPVSATSLAVKKSRHMPGVIAVAIFVIVSCFIVFGRLVSWRKDTYQHKEAKKVRQEETTDLPFIEDADFQIVFGETTKEYFI